MKRLKLYIAFSFFILLATSCLREIDLKEIETDELLIVDALITDQVVKQQIKLSITGSLESEHPFNPQSNAVVFIEDSDQTRFVFSESSPGIYISDQAFGAVSDKTYILTIQVNGKTYKSDASIMSPTPPMDSIYMDFELESTFNNDFVGYFNVYADLNNNPDSHKHFRYTWNSVYELTVPMPSRWLWTGGNTFILREKGSDNDSLQVESCWTYDSIQTLDLVELIDGETSIIKHPIHRFHSSNSAMKIKYSIEVKQYALSEESFKFWKLIDKSIGTGFLFDTQVGTISGNVYNTEDRYESVLGFFEVVQEQSIRRIYTSRDFRKYNYLVGDRNIVDCSREEPVILELDELDEFMSKNSDYYTLCYFITSPPTVVFCRKRCSDCLEYGETNQKPEFW